MEIANPIQTFREVTSALGSKLQGLSNEPAETEANLLHLLNGAVACIKDALERLEALKA